MNEKLLQIEGLTVQFGGVTAVDGLNMELRSGEILGLIGPNGAGKTTVFNCITGLLKPKTGKIVFHPEERLSLLELAPHEVISVGIARTFQNIRLFPNMSVMENVLVGRHCRMQGGVWDALLRTSTHKTEEGAERNRAREFLKFVGLEGRNEDLGRNLPYADQRRLEIARALASEPALLLLDEPAAGMNQGEKKSLMQLIGEVQKRGTTILLIEHDMKVVMGISHRVAVMDFGRKIAEGSPESIQNNADVIEAYLGPTPMEK